MQLLASRDGLRGVVSDAEVACAAAVVVAVVVRGQSLDRGHGVARPRSLHFGCTPCEGDHESGKSTRHYFVRIAQPDDTQQICCVQVARSRCHGRFDWQLRT